MFFFSICALLSRPAMRRDGKGWELGPFHVLSGIGIDANLFPDFDK